MPNFIDLTGQIFDRLTVIKRVLNRGKKTTWLCICSCGNETNVTADLLRRGRTKSCGCLRKKGPRTRHGMSYTPTHRSWSDMIQRCTNPKRDRYKSYGGRGIKVCDRWLVFDNFFEDMGERPTGTSLDRINVNGNYEPSNCRWATDEEQRSNMTTNRYVSYKGETKHVAEWARLFGIKPQTLIKRLDYGWSIERALMENVRGEKHD